MYGPYPIIAKEGHSYRLKLPNYMKIYDVLHADRLRKSPDNPLLGQVQPEEPPVEINSQLEWIVQEILDSKVDRRSRGARQRLLYKAKWVGWDPNDQYYPARNFVNSAQLIKEYHERYPGKPGPPMRLEAWLEAEKKDEILDRVEEDDFVALAQPNRRSSRVREIGKSTDLGT